jgi:hypothetical protein
MRGLPIILTLATVSLLLAPGPSASAGEAEPTVTAQPPAPPKPEERAPAAPATVLQKEDVQGVLGKEVRNSAGQDMGRIVDVIVDKEGRARAAVIDFGGFLGVGSRKIAVSWSALQFTPTEKSNQVMLALNRDQLRAAPEYKEGRPAVVLGASGASEPFEPSPN